MLYCHSRGIVHRDLKLENVLFKNENYEEDFFVKVVDFGIAGMGGQKVDAGTLMYMAPECLEKDTQTTPAMDVWAIGVMFYTMLYGNLPFQGNDEKLLIKSIKNDELKFPAKIPVTNEAKDALKLLLTKDHTKRIELVDFVDHPYCLMDEIELDEKIAKATAISDEIIKEEERLREEEEKF
jgi:NUAK family SNF1-like kinase